MSAAANEASRKMWTERFFKQHGVSPLTAGAAYIQVFIFYQHIKYHILNMLKIKCDINQQDLKIVDLHFVKSEWFSLSWSWRETQLQVGENSN